MARTSRCWLMKQKPIGPVKTSDFQVVHQELPPLQDGEYLCEAEWWSADPFIRLSLEFEDLGAIVPTFQLAKVVESKNSQVPVGALVVGLFGWRTLTIDGDSSIWKEKCCFKNGVASYLLPDIRPSPPSAALGILGMPGVTAFFGVFEYLQPKKGEILFVNSAAGAVGSAVGQIAKILGCTVIGCTSTDAKADWLQSIGFHHVINYKTADLGRSLKEIAPEGINCFFDNVGGDFLLTAAAHLSPGARVCLCGAISLYDKETRSGQDILSPKFDTGSYSVERIDVSKWMHRAPEAIEKLLEWIKQEKLKFEETKYRGFEQIPTAFLDQMRGKNLGKVVIESLIN